MNNTISISNKKFNDINSKLYKMLSTIPEDPLFWSDWDCYAFDNAIHNIEFFIKDNDDYVLVETYELYENTNDIPQSDEGVLGQRHLVVFRRDVWENLHA